MLLRGDIILHWHCMSTATSQHFFTHVPWHNQKPWRPCTLQLEPATEASLSAFLDACDSGAADAYISFKVPSMNGVPNFASLPEFVQRLNLVSQQECTLRLLVLSGRATPFPEGAGLVRATSHHQKAEVQVWPTDASESALLGLQNYQSKRRKEKLKAEDESSDGNSSAYGSKKESEEGEAQADADSGKEADEDDLAFGKDLLDLWGEPGQALEHFSKVGSSPHNNSSSNSSASGSSSRSSSSSNDASSSPSKSKQKAGAIASVSKPTATASANAPVSKATAKASAKAETEDQHKNSRDYTNRLAFGPHHLVRRYGGGHVVGYFMACKYPAHQDGLGTCSKEMAVRVAGSEEAVRRVLKAWILLAPTASNRADHMSRSFKDELLRALHVGTLLDEKTLDDLAPLAEDDKYATPYCLPCSQQGEKALLGSRGEVPEKIHAEMEKLARQGRLPITTPEQRSRNGVQIGSKYQVPQSLHVAMRHAYIGPNLPPPAGLTWRNLGGSTWKLCVRGG
eukprot:6473182-Amphidinium_carterae.4